MKNLLTLLFTFALVFSNPLVAQDKEEKKSEAKSEEKTDEKKSEKKPEKKNAKKKKAEKKSEGKKKKPKANPDHKRLGELFRKGWETGKTLSEDEAAEFVKLLPSILPGKDFLGDDLEWRIKLQDGEGDTDKVDINLAKKDAGPYERLLWVNIFFRDEPNKEYGNDEFEGYRAMGIPGIHQFIMVGHLEIRAVATTSEYRSDKKIHGALKAFPLKAIEKL